MEHQTYSPITWVEHTKSPPPQSSIFSDFYIISWNYSDVELAGTFCLGDDSSGEDMPLRVARNVISAIAAIKRAAATRIGLFQLSMRDSRIARYPDICFETVG